MTTPTQRLPDWMVRLDALVRASADVPFAWGVHDCCTLAADVVQACTGTDPMADLRGQYGSALGAARLIEAHGGMVALLDARMGPRVPLLCAQPGDVGLCDDGRVVWFGGQLWHGPGDAGLVVTGEPVTVWRCHHG